MPVRSVRIHVYNESSYLTMQRTALQSCSGGWTDGWAPPPSTIAPGANSLFQAESDGVATGAIGYIKFDLLAVNGRHGMVYLYWDNPYMGATNFKLRTDMVDVPVDCGPTDQNPSTFSDSGNPQTLDFGVQYAYGDLDGDNAMNDTPLQTLGSVVEGPATIFGESNIIAHAWVDIHIQDQEPRGLSSTPPAMYTFSAKSNVVPTDWVGHWSGSGVDVQISSKSGSMVSVQVTDSSKPPFAVTESVNLTQLPLLIGKETEGTLVNRSEVSDPKSVGQATKQDAMPIAKQLKVSPATSPLSLKTAAANPAGQGKMTDKMIVEQPIHEPVATPTTEPHYKDSIALGSGVSLTLMNVQANGQPNGTSVRYQRHSKTPAVSLDVELMRYVPPPR
jgi:hypothetical protein